MYRFLANATVASHPASPVTPAKPCSYMGNCSVEQMCLTGQCVPATAFYHTAVSPLLDIQAQYVLDRICRWFIVGWGHIGKSSSVPSPFKTPPCFCFSTWMNDPPLLPYLPRSLPISPCVVTGINRFGTT